MGVYDRQIASVLRQLKAKGAACTWALPGGVTVDPLKPWLETAGADVIRDVTILFLPKERQYNELVRFIKGTDVIGGAVYGLMGAVPFTPGKVGVITRTLDGAKFGVEAVDVLAPNGEPILYTLEFRL